MCWVLGVVVPSTSAEGLFLLDLEASETANLFITVTGQSFRTIGPLNTRSYNYFSFDPGKNDTNDTNLIAKSRSVRPLEILPLKVLR
jgi:hypothetical protein